MSARGEIAIRAQRCRVEPTLARVGRGPVNRFQSHRARDMENTPKRDLKSGVALDDLPDGGIVLGNVEAEEVILVRRGEEFFAVGEQCTHYHGPLAEGLIVDDTVRCPWHHACFSLRTGEAVRAPALSAVDCWSTQRQDGKVVVLQKMEPAPARRAAAADAPQKIVIVGGGAAGFAAAEMLRRSGYA